MRRPLPVAMEARQNGRADSVSRWTGALIRVRIAADPVAGKGTSLGTRMACCCADADVVAVALGYRTCQRGNLVAAKPLVAHYCSVKSESSLAPGVAREVECWWIGLDGWVLQDGNYTDCGDRRPTTVRAGVRLPATSTPANAPSNGLPRSTYTGRSTIYEVTGQLIRSSVKPHADGFVLGFGLRAYSTWMVLDDLEPPVAGDSLTGEIHLSVDPFIDMDKMAHRPDMPALIYTWTVEEIQLNRTPAIRVEFGHPLYVGPDEGPSIVRDPGREEWLTIDQTRMWDDDGGSYRLKCRLENPVPRSSMADTGPSSPYGPVRIA